MGEPFNNSAKLGSKACRLGLCFDWNWHFLNFKAVYLKKNTLNLDFLFISDFFSP